MICFVKDKRIRLFLRKVQVVNLAANESNFIFRLKSSETHLKTFNYKNYENSLFLSHRLWYLFVRQSRFNHVLSNIAQNRLDLLEQLFSSLYNLLQFFWFQTVFFFKHLEALNLQLLWTFVAWKRINEMIDIFSAASDECWEELSIIFLRWWDTILLRCLWSRSIETRKFARHWELLQNTYWITKIFSLLETREKYSS